LQNVSDDSSDIEIIQSKDRLEELYQLELEQTDIDSLPIMKALKEAMVCAKEYEREGKIYMCLYLYVFTCKCIFICMDIICLL
jgi:hypothetical protein